MKLKGFHNSIRRMAMVATCVVTVVSCSEAKFDDIAPEEPAATDKVVYIAVPELSLPKVSAATRIAVDNDDYDSKTLSLKWSDGDDFSLWAIADGDEVPDFKNIGFEYAGTEKYPAGDSRTLFASDAVPVSFLDGPYNGYAYTYTAFYPHQTDESKIDRTANRVTYEIPTVQNGRYDGKLDIMSAAPAAFSDALTPGVYQEIDLTFRHRTHALKITVPAGNNNFGDNVTRLRIEFPQAVTGNLTFDARTGEVADRSGLNENYVDIKFDEPLQEGEPFWVFIAPVNIDGEVKFTAYGGDDEILQSDPSIAATGQFGNLEAERITPVKLGIKPGFSVTWFDYEVADWSRLGEKVETLNITLPEGLQLADRSEDENRKKKVVIDDENKFRISFRTQELDDMVSSLGYVDFAAMFESEHALLKPYSEDVGKFIISTGAYVQNAHNEYSIEHIPYLFEEDFSNMTGFSSSGDNPTGNFSTVTTAEWLDDNNLVGWSAARAGGDGGNAIRICGRTEDGLLSIAHYHGRLDTCPMSNIKENVSVNVSVSFNYSIGINKSINHTPLVAYGYHTTEGKIDSKGTTSGDATPGLENPVRSDLTGTGGSYENINEYESYDIPDCTSRHRLAWEIFTSGRAVGNSNSWLYIDNIKVSIVKE